MDEEEEEEEEEADEVDDDEWDEDVGLSEVSEGRADVWKEDTDAEASNKDEWPSSILPFLDKVAAFFSSSISQTMESLHFAALIASRKSM